MKTLKNVLLVNAVSSGVTGIGLLAFSPTVAILFGVPSPFPVTSVGIFLIVFAVFVFIEGRRSAPQVSRVKVIVALDTIWVVASLFIVALQLFELTLIGYFAMGAVALWVATMAYLQNNGIRQITVTKL
jgi:hypothetical protein